MKAVVKLSSQLPPINARVTASVLTLVESLFSVRGLSLFNCLTNEIRNFNGSMEAFKSRIDKYSSNMPDQPCTLSYHQTAASFTDQHAALRGLGVFIYNNIHIVALFCFFPTGTVFCSMLEMNGYMWDWYSGTPDRPHSMYMDKTIVSE